MSIAERRTALATADFVEGLRQVLGAECVTVDPDARLAASTDHSWLSPSCAAPPLGDLADVVVNPPDTVGLARALALAYRAGVAVVPRGEGTGTLGGAVPRRGGLVIGSGRRSDVLDVGDGWIEAEAGATFVDLQRAARQTGQEVALVPSTIGSALGGFLGGGVTGSGSLEQGSLWDGFVLDVEVLPAWDAPEPISAVGEAALPFLHAYGTTGIVVTARVKLVPARRWRALFASFASYEAAAGAALALAELDPAPRDLAVDEPALVDLLPADEGLVRHRASLRANVEAGTATGAGAIVRSAGGRVELVSEAAVDRVVSLSHEHVVLWSRQVRSGLRCLRARGRAFAERPDEVRACLPGGGLLHHDLCRRGGDVAPTGLLVGDFGAEPVGEVATRRLRELGLDVVDPAGGAGTPGRFEQLLATAAQFDPRGLLNPGKLATAP